MTGKKKKFSKILLLTSIVELVLGVTTFFLMKKNWPGSEDGFWIIPLLVIIFVFLIQKLYSVVTTKFLQITGSLWVYFVIGYAIIILFNALIIVADGGIKSFDLLFLIKKVNSISIEAFIVDILVFMFTLNLDYPMEVSFYDYSVFSRDFSRDNEDNIPVTLKNQMVPECHFENNDYCNAFLAKQKYIKQVAEERCKVFIFENNLQNKISGEYFLSKVDFLYNPFSVTCLKYSMVFIKTKITSYSLCFVDIGESVKEKEYCRIDCVFEYRKQDEKEPFKFFDLKIEFL